MHLYKGLKFKMIIAILLCMAFIGNIGVTLATINYRHNSKSVNIAPSNLDTNTFMEFASAETTQGSFEYGYGVHNNQLSINYGFSPAINYDLMVRFTAIYTDTEKNNGDNIHLANDFTINFVNRDKWCVDMGTIGGWKTQNDTLVADGNKYYVTGSADTQIDSETSKQIGVLTGVMYYMDTLTGSGSLPVISGVTFHTSLNNTYVYLGDKLTITLTPIYVKSNTQNYTNSHSFNSNSIDADAFKNWYEYMSVKSGNTVAGWSTRTMIYNSYVDSNRTLAYPYDEEVMTTQTITDGNGASVTKKVVNSSLKTQPNYSNTAYRYDVIEEDGQDVRRYDAITAGNRYNGGLGVYVIPDSDLLTINVSFNFSWYNWETNQLAGTTSSLMIVREYSDEIQTVSTAQGYYRYYKGTITEPIYIDILKHIMITAVNSDTIITGGYTLLINDISVGLVTKTNQSTTLHTDQYDESNNWNGAYQRPTYQVHNATHTSPILARVKDVVNGTKTYNTNISITNHNSKPLSVSGFTISGKLWYGNYKNQTSTFEEALIGVNGYIPSGSLIYDTSLWNVSYANGVFTFSLQSGKSVYIPKGYTLTLISGVTLSEISECEYEDVDDGVVANDFWCTLEVSFDTETKVTSNVDLTTDNVDYSKTSSTSVEAIVEGYYTAINSVTPGKIYIRNNTRQVITGVTLSSLVVSILDDSSTMMSRDKATANRATCATTSHLSGTVSVKPGEMVLAFTIKPTTANENAIISSFEISTTLATTEENDDMDLVYNENTKVGELINNSDTYYEFRLVSTTDLSGLLYNSSDFVVKEVSASEYHYYYIGVVCPHRSIKVLNNYGKNIIVDYLEHSKTQDSSYYVASNYGNDSWGLSDSVDEDIAWLNAMKKLYDEPTVDERKDAIVVS